MQVIGFTFTKIHAERKDTFQQKQSINTNLQFLDLIKDKLSLLKDQEVIKIKFQYSLNYSNSENDSKKGKKSKNNGEVIIEGIITIAATPEESKEVQKSWKKKELPVNMKLILYNLILKKCTVKAIPLQEEISLPHHIPLPRLQPKKE